MSADTSPFTLDPYQIREVLAIVTVGCGRKIAADYVGCPIGAIARQAHSDADFEQKLHKAESNLEVRSVGFINQAASEPRHWRAAAWLLERTHPERYGARGPRVVTTDQFSLFLGGVAEALAKEIPDEQCRARILRRVDALIADLQETTSEKTPSDPPTLALADLPEEPRDDGE